MGLFTSEKKEPQTVNIMGHPLKCSVCSNEYFHLRYIQLNTSWMSFFNLDWLNKNATCFVCSECTQIIWFDGQSKK